MIAEDVRKLEEENSILKEQLKKLEEDYGVKAGLPKDCEHCKNFIQHYIRSGGGYYPTYDGHCVASGRVRSRLRGINESCRSFAALRYGENYI